MKNLFNLAGLFAITAVASLTVLSHHFHEKSSVEAATEVKRVFGCPANRSISYSDCDITNYIMYVAVTFVPPMLMAMFTLFFIPFFYCARYCCSCCGSSTQTEGCCCACGSDAPRARYSWFEIARAKFYALLCAGMCAAVIIYGTEGSAKAKSGSAGLIDSLAQIPAALVREIDGISAQLTIQMYNMTSDSLYSFNLFTDTSAGQTLNTTVHDTAKSLEKTITDGTASAKSGLDLATTVLFIVILVPACFMGVVFVFSLLNCRNWGPMLLTLLLFIFQFVLWMANGGIAIGGLIISDVCAEIQGIANQELNVVSALITCPTSTLDSARANFASLEATQANAACIKMNSTCVIPTNDNVEFLNGIKAGRIFECPQPNYLNCTGATFARLLNYSDVGMKINSSVYSVPNAESEGYVCRNTSSDNCSLSRCAETCTFGNGTRSTTGKFALVAVSAFRAAATVARVFADIGARFYVCESLLSIIAAPMAGPCADISQGFFDTYMATGVELMFLIFTIFACAWGSKRFIPFSEAGKLQDGSNDAKRNDETDRPIPRGENEGKTY